MHPVSADAEAVRTQAQWLRGALVSSPTGWLAFVPFNREERVECLVAGGTETPSPSHLQHAAVCLASLNALVSECERTLNDVAESHPLFPPRENRKWFFEGMSFVGADPNTGEAHFSAEEAEGSWEYLYVAYSVQLINGGVASATARTR
jgi:hypothetical protein